MVMHDSGKSLISIALIDRLNKVGVSIEHFVVDGTFILFLTKYQYKLLGIK